jgi:ribosome maturation protein Sdo1
MVTTVIRRISRHSILKDIKREQIDTSKTGIHPNPVVNDAIDKVDVESRGSGSGTATASTTIPKLLKKRRELEKSGKNVSSERD